MATLATLTTLAPIAPAHLSADQRAAFERDGFLVVKRALDPAAVAHFRQVVQAIDAGERQRRALGPEAFIEVRHAIHHDHRLLDLLMWPTVFPLVAELMGPDLTLTTTHTLIRPPQPAGTPRSFKAIGWHRDAHGNVKPVHGTCPWIYTKIGFFLTDLSRPGMGNLRVIPGSHLRADPPPTPEGAVDPEGAIEVLLEPGDAVLFQQRVWHAVGPNDASHARENIYLGYSYRWVRPIDALPAPADLLAKADPVQRQLLGAIDSPLTWFLPQPDDVPLHAWLDRHRAETGTTCAAAEDACACG